jgi:hypothetical protein
LVDAFSSREAVATPHQVRGRLSLENALERDEIWLSRPVNGFCLPLPLAGEVDARSAAGGGSPIHSTSASCGSAPTPTLPRKRERERAAIAFADQANLIMR